MMINKKLSVLAAAIVASSAQASFDADSISFVAVNSSGDTYVADLGNVSDFLAGNPASVAVDPSALGTYSWTIVGANSTGTPLAAPPGNYSPTADTGVISATAGTDTSVSTVATGALVASERTAVNNWLSDVNAADGDNDGYASISGGNAGEFLAGMQVAHQAGAMQSGFGTVNLLGIYQAAGSNTTAPDVSILNTTLPVTFDGANVSAVPVPAAAWLFGSALAGLTVVRRRK
jgi:hypothetical protein